LKVKRRITGNLDLHVHYTAIVSDYENLQEKIKKMNLGKVDSVLFQYSENSTLVTIETDEFTSICPRTGMPDYGKITIHYLPDKKIIELKSLKLYLYRYRNIGIFQENAINKILDDLVKSASPKFMVVIGEFNPRGGLRTRITSRYEKIKR
jgi:7-cyano-7-deazaguanine reductase